MKNIFLFLLIFFAVKSTSAQQGIKFETTTFKEILAKAKAEKKLVFVDAMASWCGPCKMMEKNVFPTQTVGDYYNANFINARFDMEKGEGRDIAKQFGVSSYPTYLFVNGDGQLVSRNYGYLPPSTFIEIGKEANAFLSSAGTMKERFDKGEKDPDFLVSIIRLNAQSDYEFARKASQRYFENKKTREFTADEVGYLVPFIKSSRDYNYGVFERNKAELIKIFPEKTYDEFMQQIQLNEIREATVDQQKKIIRDDYFMSNAGPILGTDEAKKQLSLMKLGYYQQNNNFAEFEKAALDYFRNPETADQNHILRAAQFFAEKATSTESLKAAERWVETMHMSRGETADSSLLLAKLYRKSGKKAEAKMFAELALNLAAKSNADTTEIHKLLSELK